MENEQEEKIYYNWMLALLLCLVLICFKILHLKTIEDMSWGWILLPLWLPLVLSLLISLIRKLF